MLAPDAVGPRHIDAMLRAVVKRGAPVWHLPGIRAKTGQPLDIPLPTVAVEWLQKPNSQDRPGQGTLTPVDPGFDDGVMGLLRIKLTLPSDLREYVVRRVTLGGYINAGEYVRQLIRSDALAQQDRRLRDGLAAHESGRGDLPDGASRRGTGC